MKHLTEYRKVQSIAKDTIAELKKGIKAGISEREIMFKAEEIMRSKGIENFWYYDIGAFVHVGKRTIISESGKQYTPSEIVVGRNDIITVDLSPELDNYWGDYARTIIVMDGNTIDDDSIENAIEFSQGINTGKELHRAFIEFIKPDMTFEKVYLHMNAVIHHLGYSNLDFSGNLGHSIAFNKDQRKYFELGNETKLSEVSYFTFEPHVKQRDGVYGYKREDIYYFQNGNAVAL
ncbi:M24 family metallopeptidase [Paenibacillus sinopodophylli]|uniref:M24 family metallopeptidase n=1 Tax=Paenibacillus sinopodophylli TaxID=1837342 RepID=UPI00110CA14D|nr:M24 family metallopeptidase [Paenibacillus sinopodophylli]